MTAQLRRLFVVILVMFAALAMAISANHVLRAPMLTADSRNARTVLHAAEIDRGPLIVEGEAIATSTRVDGTQRYQRSYPMGSLYAHVTGYFSSTFSQSTAMEAAMNDVLSGESTALIIQRFRNMFTGASRKGGGVVLTLNPTLQDAIARTLGNRRGAGVVLDVETGAILALYSSPSFDPNTIAIASGSAAEAAYQKLLADESKPLYNRAIGGNLYPPGSTFKVLTSIAMLEKGLVAPDTEVEAPLSVALPGSTHEVKNYGGSACGNGRPTFVEAFARSCNTPFVLASQQLTQAELTNVTERFGFGKSFSIPLNVTPSIFPSEMDAAQRGLSVIGQFDVKVTPLQMAMVAQAIAKKGELMTPYLVSEVVDADLQTRSKTEPRSLGQAVSPEIANVMTEMMKQVVTAPYGTGQRVLTPHVEIAAKTGTAEVGDGSGRTIPSMMGFAPANAPKVAFAVFIEGEPGESTATGGTLVAPVVRAIVEEGLK